MLYRIFQCTLNCFSQIMSKIKQVMRVNRVISSDEIQNFKNRFSFVSSSLTTGSLILESPFAAVV